MIDLDMKFNLYRALQLFDKTDIKEVRRGLYKVLVTAEANGWQYMTRGMYGGGTEITVAEGINAAAYLIIGLDGKVDFMPEDAYFTSDFQPKVLMAYNEELDAEMKNEEALYKYELPRPWIHYW